MNRSPNNPRSLSKLSVFAPALAALTLGSVILTSAPRHLAFAQEASPLAARAEAVAKQIANTQDKLKMVVSAKGGGIGNRPDDDNTARWVAQFCYSRLGKLMDGYNDFRVEYAIGQRKQAFSDFRHGLQEALEVSDDLGDGEVSIIRTALKTGERVLDETSKLLDGHCTDEAGDPVPLDDSGSCPAIWHVGTEDDARSSAEVKAEIIVSYMEKVIEKAADLDTETVGPFWHDFPGGVCGEKCRAEHKDGYAKRRHEFEDKYLAFSLDMIRWSQTLGEYIRTEGMVPHESYELSLKLVHTVVEAAATALSHSYFDELYGCPVDLLLTVAKRTVACAWTPVKTGEARPVGEKSGKCVTYEYQRITTTADGQHVEESMSPQKNRERRTANQISYNTVSADVDSALERIEKTDFRNAGCPLQGKPFADKK